MECLHGIYDADVCAICRGGRPVAQKARRGPYRSRADRPRVLRQFSPLIIERGSGQDRNDSASCRVPIIRIRALYTVKSTRGALAYLLASSPEAERRALEHLLALCYVAVRKRGLYLNDVSSVPIFQSWAWWRMTRELTMGFLRGLVLKILTPYRGKPRRNIMLAALANKFRYIPRRAVLRTLDKLSRDYKVRNIAIQLTPEATRNARFNDTMEQLPWNYGT